MNSAGGRCHDNARCESMWARFKEELLYGRYDTTSMTVEQLKTLIWRYFISYWYLRTVIVTAAVHWGFDSMLAHLLLTFQHRAGVSSYTSSFDLAQTCVFGKQLLGPILCGSISGAPLLPKLRGQFAEFLNNPSPVGLRIFFLPTCVGLRYGHLRNTHSFSRHLPSQTSVLISLDLYRNQHPALRLQMCPCA